MDSNMPIKSNPTTGHCFSWPCGAKEYYETRLKVEPNASWFYVFGVGNQTKVGFTNCDNPVDRLIKIFGAYPNFTSQYNIHAYNTTKLGISNTALERVVERNLIDYWSLDAYDSKQMGGATMRSGYTEVYDLPMKLVIPLVYKLINKYRKDLKKTQLEFSF